ncbi:LOW QUALITY PROTEIN: hypothetical protein T265_12721 [Opisthorchis viverrini]|uniref:Uncharacterized protein n=1 Tax=Opisthorchis viverrini TaxID=6198 RepID=A0A074ZZE6_OPIVI|nr:LOW QUALITY PROTEIN: hypothetical protein T265_12721 [Opisthorchis viverrini]KER32828.1 LOW QUALITY PROTEIN: hypothetical protein T265_12721 [Opisthorchis viverrini]
MKEPAEYKRTFEIEESMHLFGLLTDAYSNFSLSTVVRKTMMHKLEHIVLPVVSHVPLSHFVNYINKRARKENT